MIELQRLGAAQFSVLTVPPPAEYPPWMATSWNPESGQTVGGKHPIRITQNLLKASCANFAKKFLANLAELT